mmetsp:Transcript_20237/g.57453  ORF Transcript_20237/g.57453 Transcript_20237/m.57453 type:complete len:280 (-) Transcript_20237:799-1638(-)
MDLFRHEDLINFCRIFAQQAAIFPHFSNDIVMYDGDGTMRDAEFEPYLKIWVGLRHVVLPNTMADFPDRLDALMRCRKSHNDVVPIVLDDLSTAAVVFVACGAEDLAAICDQQEEMVDAVSLRQPREPAHVRLKHGASNFASFSQQFLGCFMFAFIGIRQLQAALMNVDAVLVVIGGGGGGDSGARRGGRLFQDGFGRWNFGCDDERRGVARINVDGFEGYFNLRNSDESVFNFQFGCHGVCLVAVAVVVRVVCRPVYLLLLLLLLLLAENCAVAVIRN